MSVQALPTIEGAHAGGRFAGWPAQRLWMIAALAAMAVGGYARSVYQAGSPLWLDETYTGFFAMNADLGGVLRDVLSDVNAPLYHVVSFAFAKVFGLSDAALRAPSLIFGFLAPLLCLVPAPGLDRAVRFAWSALVALWLPALQYSLEARCYTMLLCLCVAQTTAFLWLIDRPTLRRGAMWTALASAAVLTHYFAVILVAVQGAVYLARHRGQALRTWPALLAAVPGLAWVAFHFSRLAMFTDGGVAWHPQVGWIEIARAAVFVFGSPWLVLAGGLILIAMLAAALFVPDATRPAAPAPRGPGLAVAASALALAAFMALAAWRQIFFPRYLFPYMPGLLLGLALAATRFRGRLAALPAALFAVALVEAAELPQRPWMKARAYSIETASSDLMAAGSGHLAFFFDHPTTRKADAEPLARLGGFFFRRAGAPVEVSPLIPKAGQDPNAALLALADRPRSAILWMYDLSVPLTQAIAHPPRIAQTPGWTCRDYGGSGLGLLACRREEPR